MPMCRCLPSLLGCKYVAFLLQPSALHGDCNIPVRPTAAAYQAALLAAAQAFKCNLQSVANRYSEHTSQASAWRLYLLYQSQFLLLHETAPILASLCKQFLHTLSLLCWFHVKQAWDENGKAKVQPKEQWPEVYGKLEKIMYAKTWEKLRQLATAFVQCYQESQPAAVKYFRTIGSVKSGSVSGLEQQGAFSMPTITLISPLRSTMLS